MVHELAEHFLLRAGLFCVKGTAHLYAEFIEGEYRLESGIPPCTDALEDYLVEGIRKFEEELTGKIAQMRECYEPGKLFFKYNPV